MGCYLGVWGSVFEAVSENHPREPVGQPPHGLTGFLEVAVIEHNGIELDAPSLLDGADPGGPGGQILGAGGGTFAVGGGMWPGGAPALHEAGRHRARSSNRRGRTGRRWRICPGLHGRIRDTVIRLLFIEDLQAEN